jgi:hypothetical protein
MDLDIVDRFVEYRPRSARQAARAPRVRAGGADDDRANDIENAVIALHFFHPFQLCCFLFLC